MAYEEILTKTTGVSTDANQGLNDIQKLNARNNIGAAPASHISDTTAHITSSERNAWNAKASKPIMTSITLFAADWTGTSNPYSQAVTIPSATENSKIDLQPTAI